MPRTDRALRRIVERLGAERLAQNPTLVRTALKDLFPEDPLAVSVLTAAVENGAVTRLQDPYAPVPADVLGPRLASALHRSTGISEPRARWAVGAWAHALGLLPEPVTDLPRDGTEPDVAALFARPVKPEAASVGEGETTEAPAADTPTAVSGAATVTSTPPLADGPDTATVITSPATAAVDDRTPRARGLEPETVRVEDAETTPFDGGQARGADVVAAVPVVDLGAPTVLRPDAPDGGGADALAEPQGAGDGATDDRPVDDLQPSRQTKGPRRRRRIALALVGAVVLLAAVGIVLIRLLAAPSPLQVSALTATATTTRGGATTALHSGVRPATGSQITVTKGTLQLTSGSSVLRLGQGAHVRIDGPAAVTLLSGRLFVNADSSPIEVRDAAGLVHAQHARVMAACSATDGCRLTALDEPLTATIGSTSRMLRAHEQLVAKGAISFVAPDALRGDPWLQQNDRLDVTQTRALHGVAGASVLGHWTLHAQRTDLPVTLVRTVTFTPVCTAVGCTLRASISMADDVRRLPIAGAVTTTSSSGSRMSVAYGSHPARCAFVPGQTKPRGTDGDETVSDTFTVQGGGTARTLTGTRTTGYTPTGAHCTQSRYTAHLSTRLTGRPGEPTAKDLSTDGQQLLLNYVTSYGTGCAAGSGAPATHRLADIRCTYPGSSGGPASVEWATYDGSKSGEIGAAYQSAIAGYGLHDTGDCTTGPCEQVAPDGHGRLLLTQQKDQAVLITYDPRAARLLVIARGASTRGLLRWWSGQQASHSVYTSSPLPRVGV